MYTPPNRYWAIANWRLELLRLNPNPGSWEFDLQKYQTLRDEGCPLIDSWTKVNMSITNAQNARVLYCPNEWNHSSLIPPEIFSHLLARSMGKSIQDEVPVVLEEEPATCVDPKLHFWIPRRTAAKVAKAKAPKRKAPKRKITKGAKRKAAKAKRRS